MSGGVVACGSSGATVAAPAGEGAMPRKAWQFITRHHALFLALLLITESGYRGGC